MGYTQMTAPIQSGKLGIMIEHTPRKRFGQHFLTDEHVIAHIVTVVHPKPDENIVEIGPGLGALTTKLLPLCKALNVIELDRDVIAPLKKACKGLGDLVAHQTDVLDFDFNSLVKPNKPLRLVGNLPYNISTPFLFHALSVKEHIQDMHFMLQKEVVDRMVAKPGTSRYGRLSVMLQYHCETETLFDVPPSAFTPPPKVDSAIIRVVPRKIINEVVHDATLFEKVVRQAFSLRRKTLRNCLKTMIGSDALSALSIDPTIRPERLSVDEFVRISNNIKRD